MNILPVANGAMGTAAPTTASAKAATPSTGTASSPATSAESSTQSMFMQLLVAQLQNQDPTNPVDPTTFTSQLVQFNMLDQLSQINQTLTTAFGTAPTPSATPSSGTNSI